MPSDVAAPPAVPSHSIALAPERPEPPAPAPDAALARRVHWVLRVGAAACFVGHGAFGIITKPEWVPYFAVVGIPPEWAFALMPIVGAVDVAAGISVLLSPRPAVLLYMAVWGLWTALLRPLSGDHLWEAAERAGNYGVPLALLLLAVGGDALGIRRPRGWAPRDWLAPLPPVAPRPASPERLAEVARALRWTVALLLAGHGALGALAGKALLARHWEAAGLPGAAPLAGWLEIALAAAVLWRPGAGLLALVAAWKLATEALFPVAGAPLWEFVERGGSYAAPIALALLCAARADRLTPAAGDGRVERGGAARRHPSTSRRTDRTDRDGSGG
jgi:hypothetical protein